MCSSDLIAHAGYLLAGVAVGTPRSGGAVLLYLLTYAFTTLGAFGVLIALGRGEDPNDDLDHLRGLADRRPLLAGAMTIFLLSLTGIRDAETGRHSQRTQRYARVLATELAKHPSFSAYLTPERIELKIGERNALMVKGPNVMLGYWNNEEATRAIIDGDGWLNSGDTARFDDAGRVYITGRLKEIIVMSNGEKLPPADIESAICRDPLFEHVILIGEGKPYLTVLTSLNLKQWHKFAEQAGIADNAAALGEQAVQKALLGRIAAQMKEFPGYAQVRRLHATLEPWNVENGLLTPTLKLRRTRVMEKFQAELDEMYSGH